MVTEPISFSREIQPFRMPKLVTNEIQVTFTS